MFEPQLEALLFNHCERCGAQSQENWEVPGAYFTECPKCQLEKEDRLWRSMK